jgi:hypothetical protein
VLSNKLFHHKSKKGSRLVAFFGFWNGRDKREISEIINTPKKAN